MNSANTTNILPRIKFSDSTSSLERIAPQDHATRDGQRNSYSSFLEQIAAHEHALEESRRKQGQCMSCGRLCFQKKWFKKSVPINDPGLVFNGRCLICKPLQEEECQSFLSLCGCGTPTHTIVSFKRVPLTNERVHKGVCLQCNPKDDSYLQYPHGPRLESKCGAQKNPEFQRPSWRWSV